jgi:hypothetical protein
MKRKGNNIMIEQNGKQYRMRVFPGENSPHLMISRIREMPIGSPFFEGEGKTDFDKKIEQRFPDEEAFNLARSLVNNGFAWGEDEAYKGQVSILFDNEGKPVYDERIDIPGRPFPRNGKEYLLRLKGEF